MNITVRYMNLNPKGAFTPVNLPDCYTKIAELAFYRAESRGFEPGYELDDWIQAEQQFIELNDSHF